MSEQSELETAARNLSKYISGLHPSSIVDIADMRRLNNKVIAALPPEPITNRCIRSGCDGVPSEIVARSPNGDGFVVCSKCSLKGVSVSNDNPNASKLRWQNWYQNETGTPQ